MNIAKIRKMAAEGDLSLQGLRYLLNCKGECEHLDFKEILSINDDHGSLSLSKDIVAMKNIGGGYIIAGVKDKTWEPIGLLTSLCLDTKLLRDKVFKYTGLTIETDIVEHTFMDGGKIKRFAMILVRTSTKLNKLKTPSICRISHFDKEKWGIRQGDVYIRDGDQTKRLDDLSKLQDKLDDMQYQYEEAEQQEASNLPSPFEIETGLYRLLPREYDNFVGRKSLIGKIKNAIDKDPRIWIINLYGPGGVGKSALATCVAYDYYHEKKYEAILHLSAKNHELSPGCGIKSLQPSLVSIEDFIDRVLHLFSHQEFCVEDLSSKKRIVNELLSAWSTLIILDNMETVNDGRIMDFIREFPQSSKAKVLLTSRQRTSEWEFPIQVPELSSHEIQEFLQSRSKELGLDFPYDDKLVLERISEISGGLPLALQWILGEYAGTNNLDSILKRVLTPDSPLLEFSFRNSWKTLDEDAQKALAVLSIFNNHPTLQEWRTVLNWPIDKTERAKAKLVESTFITERTDQKTGDKIYIALPITLSFAQNELVKYGDFGQKARSRYEDYKQRISLAQEEMSQFENLFNQFELKTDNQKTAVLLAKMAEGQITSFGYREAEEYYKQALDMDPQSIYALISFGKFKADMQEYESAIEIINRATNKITKKTGFFVYYNLAGVYGQLRDWKNKIRYLKKAMSYEEAVLLHSYQYSMAQHSLGVALGQDNQHSEAIKIFDEIIDQEFKRSYGPTKTLIVAARTKKISLSRISPERCKEFLDELIIKCKALGSVDYIVDELIKIRDIE